MRTSTAVAIVAVLVLVGGGLWWYTSQQAGAPGTDITVTPGTDTPAATSTPDGTQASSTGESAVVTVVYGQGGFVPATVTIKKGQSVTWVNQGGGQMWVASAQHPTHTAYSGTVLAEHCATATNDAFDQCKAGMTYGFTFDKVGTWRYHNHAQASHFGSVVVTE
jgi:plastocyanin